MKRLVSLLGLAAALVGTAVLLVSVANCVQPPKHPYDNPETIKYLMAHPHDYSTHPTNRVTRVEP